MADPGCLSRIPDPDFYPSRIPDLGFRIPDPKTVTKERGEKNLISYFFCSHNFTKLNIMLFLKCLRKKFGPIFKELLKFLPKKCSICSQIYGFGIRDPRSGIRKKPIPDPGSGSATLPKSCVELRYRRRQDTLIRLNSEGPQTHYAIGTWLITLAFLNTSLLAFCALSNGISKDLLVFLRK